MNTKLIASAGILVVALSTSIAFAKWPNPMSVLPTTVDQDGKVNIDFDNASASDVLSWMKSAGVNFVVETSEVPKDKKLTVHIKGQPMDKAIESIADALGMTWTKKGQIYTLKNGEGVINWNTISPDKNGQWKIFSEPLGGEDWEKFREDLKGFKFDADTFPSTKILKLDGKEFKVLQEKLKEMPGLKLELDKLKGFREFDAKDLEKLKEPFKEMPRLKLELDKLKDLKLPDMSGVKIGLGTIGKLAESLTPEQIAKNEKNGHLTFEDLTPEQRDMLGDWSKDSQFTITVSRDGKTVTIKSK